MRPWLAVAVTASVLALGGHPATAHAGFEHFVGSITVIDAKHVEVRTGPSSVVSLELTPQTRYLRKGETLQRRDLFLGLQVVVDAQRVSGILTAREVRLVVPAVTTP
jgi:hypothetical protein